MIQQGSGILQLNATSTRLRRFGAVVDGGNRLMLGVVGTDNAQNQMLIG
jgi:hypothetical protein